MKNQAIIIAIVILAIVGAGLYFAFNQSSISNLVMPATEQTVQPSAPAPAIKTVEVSGTPFAFEPREIRVKKGDRVKINFTNAQGFHDFTLSGYDLKTKQIQAGQSDGFEFTADKVGTFEFYCGVPTHKEKGMVGQLIVEE